jgi:NAD(P)-dependent dehydrogenase (short-subunit alcohol dehydrogenase family)
VLERGERAVVTARDPGTVRDLVASHQGRALAQRLDVADSASVTSAVSAAEAAFGRIDVLVNNAGYSARGALEEITDAELRRQFEINVFGVLAVTRAVLPLMRRQRSGHIVQMSSVAGVKSMLGGGAYAGSKFALEGLSEGLALELAPLGIGVTIVQPGPFRTEFAGRSIHWAEPMADYAPHMGPARAAFSAMHGRQPNDPALGAQAMLAALDLDPPPMRLPLGPEAFHIIRERLSARLAELEDLDPIGSPTAFEPLQPSLAT